MGIVIRQSIITLIITYLGVVIGYFNLLWLFPYVLDPDQIGLYRVVLDIAFLLVPFAHLGLTQSLVRFYPAFSLDKVAKKGYLTFFLLASLATGSIFILLLYLFKDTVFSLFFETAPAVVHYFPLIAGLILLMVIHGTLEAYFRSLLRIIFPTALKELVLRVLTGVLVLFYFLDVISFDAVLYSLLGLYALIIAALVAYLMRIGEFRLHFTFSFLKKPFIKKMTSFSLFTVLGMSSGLIVLKIDSIMVTSMLGLEATGIYTTVFYIAVVIEIPRRIITQLATPILSGAFQHNRQEEIKNIYQKTSINQLCIGLLLFLGIWANIDNLFYFIPNRHIYEAGKLVVLIIGLGKLVDMVAGANSELIAMSKYYKFNIIATGTLAVLTIVTNLIFIPRFGMNGAAIASTVSVLIFNVVKFLFIRARFDIQPFSPGTLKGLAAGALVLYLSYFIPQQQHVLLDILLRSAFILVLFSSLLLLLNVSADVNGLFKEIVRRVRNLTG